MFHTTASSFSCCLKINNFVWALTFTTRTKINAKLTIGIKKRSGNQTTLTSSNSATPLTAHQGRRERDLNLELGPRAKKQSQYAFRRMLQEHQNGE